MTEATVLSRRDGAVTTLTINRPDKLNALNESVISGLEQAIEKLANEPETRVIILTGAGEKAFVAGADIGEIQALDTNSTAQFIARGQALMNRIERLGKPVIAAVNGFALGGGCELALACTLRFAANHAQLGLPEVKLGLIPGYGGTQRLTRQVGRGRALHLMLTGDLISAEDALGMGLVNAVVPGEQLQEHVQKLAGRLAQSAPVAMEAILVSVHGGADGSMDAGLAQEAKQFQKVAATEDMREGTGAFLEKRRPEFKGR